VRLNVFVYGTLRTDPTLNVHDQMVQWLAPGRLFHDNPGDWVLPDYGLFCEFDDSNYRPAIPAIGPVPGQMVIGDVISVHAEDFNELCRYEGFPSLYELTEVQVDNYATSNRLSAFVFVPTSIPSTFGPLVSGGDYLAACYSSRGMEMR